MPSHRSRVAAVERSGPVALAVADRSRRVPASASPATYDSLRRSAASFRYTLPLMPIHLRRIAAGQLTITFAGRLYLFDTLCP